MSKRRPCVYKILAMIMFEQGVTIADLANKTFIDYTVMCKKLNGDTKVTVEDAIAIHNALNRAVPIEVLFKKG